MVTQISAYDYPLPSLDLGLEIASRDLAGMVGELERGLTPSQRSLLHRIRLASESLGAARAGVYQSR